MRRLGVGALVLVVVVALASPAGASHGPLEGQVTPSGTQSNGDRAVCSWARTEDHISPARYSFFCYYDPAFVGTIIQVDINQIIDYDGDRAVRYVSWVDASSGCTFEQGTAGNPELPLGSVQGSCPITATDYISDGTPVGTVGDPRVIRSPGGSGHYLDGEAPCIWEDEGYTGPCVESGAHTGAFTEGDRAQTPLYYYGSESSITDLSCDNVWQYLGPSPTETLEAGEEVTLGFGWHLNLGWTQIEWLQFDPGDGGPTVEVNNPPHTSENHGDWIFTFTKVTTGDLTAARIRCRDGQGYETDRTLPAQGELPPDNFEPGEACMAEISIGLNPSSWVPALLSGTACLAEALFVPEDPGQYYDRLEAAASTTMIARGAEAITTVYTAGDNLVTNADTTDCNGPDLSLPLVPGSANVEVRPLDACAGAMSTFAATTKTILTAGTVIAGAFYLVQLLLAVWGGPKINNDSDDGSGQGRMVL
jgi:hypothetical protein